MKKPIPRIWIFIILFAAIVIAHIIILRVVVRGESGGNAVFYTVLLYHIFCV